MHFVLISVLFSVSVSVLLKLSRRYTVPADQIIAWNYPAAIALTFLFLKPDLQQFTISGAHYRLFISLGILLPGIFLAIAACIRYTGIVRTEIAQRISLIIPLAAAFLLFNEQAQTQSLIGIGIGLLAVVGSFKWTVSQTVTQKSPWPTWTYPLLIFLGMGVIDILFKQIAQHPSVPYTTSLFFVFITAGIVSFVYIAWQCIFKKQKLRSDALVWGLALGVLNFGNILFYMKGHRAIPDNPSVVFSAMNIGVIALGSMVGLLFFKEKLSLINYIAIVLSIVAIIIISSV